MKTCNLQVTICGLIYLFAIRLPKTGVGISYHNQPMGPPDLELDAVMIMVEKGKFTLLFYDVEGISTR